MTQAPHPAVDHFPQHPLQLGRFWRRACGFSFAPGYLVAHRADSSAANAGGLEDRFQQVRSRRLAVGSGDAHEHQVVARIAEERGRQRGKREAGVAHLEPRHTGGTASWARRFGHDRERAAGDGIAGKLGTVFLEPLERDEYGPRATCRESLVTDATFAAAIASAIGVPTRASKGARPAVARRRSPNVTDGLQRAAAAAGRVSARTPCRARRRCRRLVTARERSRRH